jgi:hypothetical protein
MVLQVTAWTGMIVARAQTAPVAEAVETTLDGQHPCRLCKVIDVGQKEEQKQDREIPAVKKLGDAKFIAHAVVCVPARMAEGDLRWPGVVELVSAGGNSPPTPPPRA